MRGRHLDVMRGCIHRSPRPPPHRRRRRAGCEHRLDGAGLVRLVPHTEEVGAKLPAALPLRRNRAGLAVTRPAGGGSIRCHGRHRTPHRRHHHLSRCPSLRMCGLPSRLVSFDIRLGSITSIASAAGATLAMLDPPQQADTAAPFSVMQLDRASRSLPRCSCSVQSAGRCAGS